MGAENRLAHGPLVSDFIRPIVGDFQREGMPSIIWAADVRFMGRCRLQNGGLGGTCKWSGTVACSRW